MTLAERIREVERELRAKHDQRNEWAQEIGIDQDTRHGYIVARNVYGIAADAIVVALEGKHMSEPKFSISERVHITAITKKRFVGEILDRHQDEDGAWFYTIDGRNYLHESMIAAATPVSATAHTN